MINLNAKIRELIFDYVIITIGSAIFSAAVNFLLEPAEITPGGLTGISVILHDTLNFQTGITLFILNIPLVLLGFGVFGMGFILKTAYSVFLTSLFLDVFGKLSNPFSFDMIISSVFGGVLLGLGLGLVMLRGSTTGGIDIAVKLLGVRFKKIPMGRFFLLLDSAVIFLAVLVYSNIETGLYSIIAIFLSSHVVDLLLYGKDDGRIFFIVTEKEKLIKEKILSSANRGVTLIRAEGGYTGGEKTVLLCAARVGEIKKLRKIVFENDPKAFFFIANVSEINGEGFDRAI